MICVSGQSFVVSNCCNSESAMDIVKTEEGRKRNHIKENIRSLMNG